MSKGWVASCQFHWQPYWLRAQQIETPCVFDLFIFPPSWREDERTVLSHRKMDKCASMLTTHLTSPCTKHLIDVYVQIVFVNPFTCVCVCVCLDWVIQLILWWTPCTRVLRQSSALQIQLESFMESSSIPSALLSSSKTTRHSSHLGWADPPQILNVTIRARIEKLIQDQCLGVTSSSSMSPRWRAS